MMGDVPIGAGLSSSAGLETATARVFSTLSGFDWDPVEMAKLSQKAENEWLGMNCGIMDQLISAAGQKGQALLIDCRTLELKQTPLPSDTLIVVMDTNTRRGEHGLLDSGYNKRREECEEAARVMADNQIGGLPVVRDGEVVGMITETDLFKIFLELMGAREPGVRLSVLVANKPGELARISKAIFDAGGNIMALGTFLGESSENREMVFKVDGLDAPALKEAVNPYIEKIVDNR